MFSVKEYKKGLLLIREKMKEKHYLILHTQYNLPSKAITPVQVARLTGSSHHITGNRIYGEIGHFLSDALNRLPSQRKDATYRWWRLLSSGEEKNKRFHWVMYPNLAKALEELGMASSSAIYFPEEVSESSIFVEGAVRKVTVNAYERNAEARSKCINQYGVCCSVCNFNFENFYGEVGKGFIHVHHLRQLSEISREYEVNPITDLKPVCPNCHAIIHRKTPPYTIEEVKAMISQKAVTKVETVSER